MSFERVCADVVLVGGGVIGCASALALAEAGANVLVVEQSAIGSEASGAAAGILGAQAEAHEAGPFAELAKLSLARYPELAARLLAATGVDVELRRCGVTAVAYDAPSGTVLQEQAGWQAAAGLGIAELDAAGLSAVEPHLSGGATYAVHFPHDARVDPPKLVQALHAAAVLAGASFRVGTGVRRVHEHAGTVNAVELHDGTAVSCANVVITAGSWSGAIDGAPYAARDVRPARGQMVELQTGERLLRGVVFGPRCYLVPRDDGRVLVGSTLEFVGHLRGVTAGAVRDLLHAATTLLPDLAHASFSRAWSGFRPYTSAGVPMLCATATRGLYLATGHHRNGVLLAPISAEIVRALVLQQPPPLDLGPYATGTSSAGPK